MKKEKIGARGVASWARDESEKKTAKPETTRDCDFKIVYILSIACL